MTYRVLCDIILDAGDWTTDALVARELGCSVHTAAHARQRWQRVNGEQHAETNDILPADVIALIFETREEGQTWRQVARAVKETYGLDVPADRCGDLYRRGGYKKPRSSPNVNPDEVSFPLRTVVGTMWGPKIEPPRFQHRSGQYKTACDFCPHQAHCRAHPRDLCRCETAWEGEVIE